MSTTECPERLATVLEPAPAVLFIVQVPTPQRTPVFNDLAAQGVDFGVLYLARDTGMHGWGELKLAHRHAFVTRKWIAAMTVAIAVWRSKEIKVLASFGYRGIVRSSALLAARLRKTQVVTRSDSNPIVLKDEPALRRFLRALAFRSVFPPSTRVWTIGSENQEFWENYIGRKNTRLIPYSTPVLPASSKTSPIPRVSSPDAMRILFVGRLVAIKEVGALIDAFKSLRGSEFDRWVLNIVGDGPLRSALEQEAAGDARVRFHGSVKYDELDVHYLSNDVLVLPSSREPWGLVVNEALGFGLWVIASDQVGAKELLVSEEFGYVFPTGNKCALAEGLIAARDHLMRYPIVPADPTELMKEDLQILTSKAFRSD